MWCRTETSPNPPRIKPRTYGLPSHILIIVVVEPSDFDIQVDIVNDIKCDNQHTVLSISLAITILYVMTWETAASGSPSISTFNAAQLLSPFLHIPIPSQFFFKKNFIGN